MTTSTQTTTQIGPGFCGILTLIFITLKLTGFIGWSWLWVLSPLWIPLALCLAIFALVAIVYLIFIGASAIDSANSQRKWKRTNKAADRIIRLSDAMNK